MSEEIDLKLIIRALRDISKRAAMDTPISPAEIQKAKAIAAKCYLSHTNRQFTLTNEQFQLIVDILRIKQ